MKLADLHARILASPPDVAARPDRSFLVLLDLYEAERIDGASLDDDGDMLLYQWGPYDWGSGLYFELDLTRQVIRSGIEDARIQQLHCTYRYDPKLFTDIVAGTRWCYRPAELKDFRAFVLDSEAFRRAIGVRKSSLAILIADAE